MSSTETPQFATMDYNQEWSNDGGWNNEGLNNVSRAPWQDPWAQGQSSQGTQDPWANSPGQVSSMTAKPDAKNILKSNPFRALSEEEEEEDKNMKKTISMSDLITANKWREQIKEQRRLRKLRTNIEPVSSEEAPAPPMASQARAKKPRFCGTFVADQSCSGHAGAPCGCRSNTLSIMEVHEPPEERSVNNVGNHNGWKEIEVTIDSGACDTVMPISSCTEIPLHESEKQKNGMEYEVANGQTIPNEGERHCLMMTSGAESPKKIVFQVADVHKALLSIT